MMLPSELFEQIAASLSSVGVPDSANDSVIGTATTEQRRRGPRVAADGARYARLIPLTDAIAPGPIDVSLRDVAPGGARFLFAARIPLDEQFVLVLPAADGPVAVLCGVAYWQPVAENLFAIGARFTRVVHHGTAARPAGVIIAPPARVRRAV